MSKVQTLSQARRLHVSAINSEDTADAYRTIKEAIRNIDTDNTVIALVFSDEILRLNQMIDEYTEDADWRRGHIDTDLIDRL